MDLTQIDVDPEDWVSNPENVRDIKRRLTSLINSVTLGVTLTAQDAVICIEGLERTVASLEAKLDDLID